MAAGRRRRTMSSEQRDKRVDELMRCMDREVAAEVRGDKAAAKAHREERELLRRRVDHDSRAALDEAAVARMQLANHLPNLEIEAQARRRLITMVDDFAGAMWALAPKRVIDRGWHAVDQEDQRAIEAVWSFIRRHDLLGPLNERRDAHFAAHHRRLDVPTAQLDDVLDEIGREREAQLRKELQPEDWDWIAARLKDGPGRSGGLKRPVRKKDIAKVLGRSESWQRVRKSRGKRPTVTSAPRKKR